MELTAQLATLDMLLNGEDKKPVAEVKLLSYDSIEYRKNIREEKVLKELEKLVINEERKYIRRILAVPPLTTEEERRYIQRIQQGDMQAREFFLRANQRLVAKNAYWYIRRFPGFRLEVLELIGEGNVGLIEALERFELSRGTKFSTYATPHIRKGIRNYLYDQGWVMKIGQEYFFRVVLGVRKRVERYLTEKYREPTFEELSSDMHLDVKDIARAYEISQAPVVYHPYGRGEEEYLGFEIPSLEHYWQEYEQLTEQLLSILKKVLNTREREVIIKRFGINQPGPMTLQEIGDFYGVTREAIRKIEKAAIKRIDAVKEEYKLQELLYELTRVKDRLFG